MYDSCVIQLFKVNCPVLGQSIIVALSGGYILLMFYFVLYFSCIPCRYEKSGNYTACVPCTVLITNGKRKSTEQTCVLHCTYQTVAPLSHSIALFPGLPCFYLLFAFTIKHGSGLPLLCIIVNANGSQKQGRPGEQG